MSEVIGGTIGARMPFGAVVAATGPKLATTIIVIACLSLAASGSQSGAASRSASGATSAQALSASSGNGQIGSAQGSVPDACGILTQARAATLTGVDMTYPGQLTAPTMGFSGAAIGTSCLWQDQAYAVNATVELVIVRDPNNADIVGAMKNFFRTDLYGGNLIAVRGLGDSAFKMLIAAAGQGNATHLAFVGFTKGQALAWISAASTKRSADALETEEEAILRQVADRL